MKKFFKWLSKKLDDVKYSEETLLKEDNWALANQLKSASNRVSSGMSIGDSLDSPAVRFKMFKASGGTIIETSIYDENKDRHITGLYVVTNDKDIGAEIGKILTLESLKV
jgi:hypothetical protein